MSKSTSFVIVVNNHRYINHHKLNIVLGPKTNESIEERKKL